MSYLLMSRSLTYAQRSARVLERRGITASVTRLPRSASVQGCTYGVAVSAQNVRRGLEILEKAGIPPKRIYERADDGSLREVQADDLP